MKFENELKFVDFCYTEAKENSKYLKIKLRNFLSVDLIMFSLIAKVLLESEDYIDFIQVIEITMIAIMMGMIIIPKLFVVSQGLYKFFPDIKDGYSTFKRISKKTLIDYKKSKKEEKSMETDRRENW